MLFFLSTKGVADKAKLRVIGGRLLALIGERAHCPKEVQAGKAKPEGRRPIFDYRYDGVRARVQEDTKKSIQLEANGDFSGSTWTAGLPKQKCFLMAIPVLSLISNLRKPRPKYRTGETHMKLAGINQDIFIRQWGVPEINITLDKLKRFFSLDFLPSTRNSFENDPITVWIYEKMDMFVLFRKGNLVAHFKWSEFKERSKKPAGEMDSAGTKPPSFLAATISMVA